jgi:SOS-response transcriptional repressor LexA
MLENRPSKKQRELLSFIDGFIKSNGYGPSYREIMRALDYRSVSTVAVHVDGLIKHGLLNKKDNSARSLEVVKDEISVPAKIQDSTHVDWLKREIKKHTDEAEIKILKAAIDILDQKAD